MASALDGDRGGDEWTIRIKTLNSDDHVVKVTNTSSVDDLRRRVFHKTGVETDRQRLIFQGKVLKNDKLLTFYSIRDGVTVHMVERPAAANDQTTGNARRRDSPPRPRSRSMPISFGSPGRLIFVGGSRMVPPDPFLSGLNGLFLGLSGGPPGDGDEDEGDDQEEDVGYFPSTSSSSRFPSSRPAPRSTRLRPSRRRSEESSSSSAYTALDLNISSTPQLASHRSFPDEPFTGDATLRRDLEECFRRYERRKRDHQNGGSPSMFSSSSSSTSNRNRSQYPPPRDDWERTLTHLRFATANALSSFREPSIFEHLRNLLSHPPANETSMAQANGYRGAPLTEMTKGLQEGLQGCMANIDELRKLLLREGEHGQEQNRSGSDYVRAWLGAYAHILRLMETLQDFLYLSIDLHRGLSGGKTRADEPRPNQNSPTNLAAQAFEFLMSQLGVPGLSATSDSDSDGSPMVIRRTIVRGGPQPPSSSTSSFGATRNSSSSSSSSSSSRHGGSSSRRNRSRPSDLHPMARGIRELFRRPRRSSGNTTTSSSSSNNNDTSSSSSSSAAAINRSSTSTSTASSSSHSQSRKRSAEDATTSPSNRSSQDKRNDKNNRANKRSRKK